MVEISNTAGLMIFTLPVVIFFLISALLNVANSVLKPFNK